MTLKDNGNNTAILTGIPLQANLGDNSVVIVATDSSGGITNQSFVISVSNVNDLPVFTSSPILTVDEDSVYTYNITLIDEDNQICNITSSTLPSFLTLTDNRNNTAILTGTPLQNTTEELWTLLNFVAPDDFSSKATFADKFGDLQNSNQLDNDKIFNNFNNSIVPGTINSIKLYSSQNNKNTKNIVFYSGGNSVIPPEIYNNFLKTLGTSNYNIYCALNNKEKNEELFDDLEETENETILMAHSSGCINAIEEANNNKFIKKLILLDPVNNKDLFKINLPLFSNNKKNKLQLKYINDVLLLTAEKSYDWSFFPKFNMPFIPAFAFKETDIII